MFTIDRENKLYFGNRCVGYVEENDIYYYNQRDEAELIGTFEKRSDIARIIRDHLVKVAKCQT